MSMKPTVAKALDPAVIAGTVRAAQEQKQHHAPHSHAPSHLSRMLAIGIWLAAIGTIVAMIYTR